MIKNINRKLYEFSEKLVGNRILDLYLKYRGIKMLNSALVIGYGSMGRRHARILKNKIKVKEITICTRQKINRFSTLRNLSDLKTKGYY